MKYLVQYSSIDADAIVQVEIHGIRRPEYDDFLVSRRESDISVGRFDINP